VWPDRLPHGFQLVRCCLCQEVFPDEVERLTLALDDTPTQRYGLHVQGAGVHHNPTPGPAGSPHVYGHVFVVLALLVAHPAWGVIALPLLARMYVRKKDLPGIDPKHRPTFRTKRVMAFERLRKDAALRTVPGPPPGQRGRPRIYGKDKIDLAKRAGQ
jgi:hypothetical protein